MTKREEIWRELVEVIESEGGAEFYATIFRPDVYLPIGESVEGWIPHPPQQRKKLDQPREKTYAWLHDTTLDRWMREETRGEM